ncbi:hypothetical protein QVD17_37908 [Tagetes erecta]|uniref:Uncharacterized protein n=1 Tax=Tagetes erecta TaxID=13708 RepID=A0AAD8ND43_TARER|nr:hypothetical protein QVD17_37908 [Tagetes erecta]
MAMKSIARHVDLDLGDGDQKSRLNTDPLLQIRRSNRSVVTDLDLDLGDGDRKSHRKLVAYPFCSRRSTCSTASEMTGNDASVSDFMEQEESSVMVR